MDEYDARIRIDRAERAEGKDVVGTFEHPAPSNRCLMLQVLQEALVKPIGVEVSGLIEPTAISRNTICRVEAQAGEDVRCNLGTFLRRRGIDRMHAPKLWRQHAEHAQLPGDPPRPRVGAGTGSVERVGMDQLPDARTRFV